jgi:hypothetical protein
MTSHHDGLTPRGGACDRSSRGQRNARTGTVRLDRVGIGVDHDEVVAVDERQRPTAGSQQSRQPLDDGMGDVGLRDGRRARRRQILQRLQVPDRVLGGHDSRLGALALSPQDLHQQQQEHGHRQRRGPARQLPGAPDPEVPSRLDDEPQAEHPGERRREEPRAEASVGGAGHDDADEDRVQRDVRDRNAEEKIPADADQRGEHREAVPLPGGSTGRCSAGSRAPHWRAHPNSLPRSNVVRARPRASQPRTGRSAPGPPKRGSSARRARRGSSCPARRRPARPGGAAPTRA